MTLNQYLLARHELCLRTRYLASLLGFRSVPEILDLPQRRRGTSRQEMMLYERDPPLIREDVLERASFKRSPPFGLLRAAEQIFDAKAAV